MDTIIELSYEKETRITVFFDGDMLGFLTEENHRISPTLIMALIAQGILVLEHEAVIEKVPDGLGGEKDFLKSETYVYVAPKLEI